MCMIDAPQHIQLLGGPDLKKVVLCLFFIITLCIFLKKISVREYNTESKTVAGIELARIPAGKFLMGNLSKEAKKFILEKRIQQEVTIEKEFWMGRYEVTQSQWESIMGKNPSKVKGSNDPVENVSWDDCQDFIEKLNKSLPSGKFSLPSAAQWEYACRAGTTSLYSFGDDKSLLSQYACSYPDAKRHEPVGQRKPNNWGLYNMLGNVTEWCADRYNSEFFSTTNPDKYFSPPHMHNRIDRGGSYASWWVLYESAYFANDLRGHASYLRGLRLVFTE